MTLRRFPAAVAVFIALVHVFVTTASAYTQAEDRILLERHPFATQATLDSDFRLQGMGGLDLPVSDESNKVGTFKYGQAPAGLAQDYEHNKVEFGITGEAGTLEDKDSRDSTYRGDVAEIGQSSLHGMVALRTGSSPENHGAFVVGVIGEGSEIDYTGSYTSAVGYRTLENKPALGQLRLGYGHQIGRVLLGFGIDSVNATLLDQEGTTLVGNALKAKVTSKIVDVVPSVGYVAPLQQGALTFTFSPRFRSTESKLEVFTNESKTEQDGALIDLGVHYGNGGNIQSALYLTFGSLDGDVTQNNNNVGNADSGTTALRFRLNARPQASPVSFGLLLESSKITSEQEDLTGDKVLDDEITENTVGGGIAYHFADNKGLVGVELRILKIEDTDILFSAFNEDSKGYELRLGGERIVGSKLWLRAGFNVKSLDVTPAGDPELNVITSQLALGAEYLFNERASLAMNLSSVGITSEGSFPAGVDEQEYGAGIFQLVGKIRFGEPAVQ